MPKAPEAPEVNVKPEKAKKSAKAAPKRKAPVARKEPQPIGRRPLGIKTMSVVLQIRMTEEELLAVRAMGGSTWARKTLEAALKWHSIVAKNCRAPMSSTSTSASNGPKARHLAERQKRQSPRTCGLCCLRAF